jgi:hypothetical protein
MRNLLLALSLAACVFLAHRVVHLENQLYAMVTGLCTHTELLTLRSDCLGTVQTRTSWLWHLYYGVTD